jgi:3-hydroxyisobutyrate dehydrogenase-like beta-hydroxyacid dehydrogenase
MPVSQRVGVVGLGTIGGGIAVSLARRGRSPVVFDVRPEAANSLPGQVTQLGSPAEVSRSSDVVIVSVVDAAQATEVVTGPNGLLSGAHPDLVVLVTATVAVRVVRELAEACAIRGVALLDCGVTGGSRASEHGLLALVGGPGHVVARVKPVLDDFAEQVAHCGPLGSGMATKIARNVITYGCWRAVHEAVELAEGSGVDPAIFLEVIEASDPDHIAVLTLQRLRMAGRTVDDSSRLLRTYWRNMDKDLGAAQQLATDLSVTVPLVDVARAEGPDTFAWLERLERSEGRRYADP